MHQPINDKTFKALFALYNKEIDLFKQKLLNGESWEKLDDTRKNITKLAIALHKVHHHIVPDWFKADNPAEFPQLDESSSSAVQ